MEKKKQRVLHQYLLQEKRTGEAEYPSGHHVPASSQASSFAPATTKRKRRVLFPGLESPPVPNKRLILLDPSSPKNSTTTTRTRNSTEVIDISQDEFFLDPDQQPDNPHTTLKESHQPESNSFELHDGADTSNNRAVQSPSMEISAETTMGCGGGGGGIPTFDDNSQQQHQQQPPPSSTLIAPVVTPTDPTVDYLLLQPSLREWMADNTLVPRFASVTKRIPVRKPRLNSRHEIELQALAEATANRLLSLDAGTAGVTATITLDDADTMSAAHWKEILTQKEQLMREWESNKAKMFLSASDDALYDEAILPETMSDPFDSLAADRRSSANKARAKQPQHTTEKVTDAAAAPLEPYIFFARVKEDVLAFSLDDDLDLIRALFASSNNNNKKKRMNTTAAAAAATSGGGRAPALLQYSSAGGRKRVPARSTKA